MRWHPALLVIALAAAGCVGNGAPDPPDADAPPVALPRWSELALASDPQHNHTNRSQHAGLSTPNFEIVGWDPLVSPTVGHTPGGHFCGDAQDTLAGRRIAALEQRNIGGFVFVDVTNPAEPEWLGELVLSGTRVYDLAVVPDGAHVVLVTTEQVDAPVAAPGPRAPDPHGGDPTIVWRGRCGEVPLRLQQEDPVPRPASLLLVNIENPAEPRIIDQRPLPLAGHSAFATLVGGEPLLLITGTGPQGNRYHQFYGLLDTPAGAVLDLLGTYAMTGPNEATGGGRIVHGHDGWIATHPLTGRTLAYLAGGTEVHIVDVTDPRAPQRIGRWSDWSPDRADWTGHLHSAYPLPDAWDGRHYTLVGPEYQERPGPLPSGVIWVLDTTDPGAPREIGAWTLPHQVEWNGTYMFSNHYFSVHGRTAFVSMYHGGIWAVDLGAVGTADFVLLPSVGVFLPDRVSPAPPQQMIRWTPTIEEAIAFPDGTIITFDETSGLYTLRFHEDRPAPPPVPWPLEAVPASR